MSHTLTAPPVHALPAPPPRRRLFVALLAALVVGCLLSVFLGPRSPGLSDDAQSGDPDLISDVRSSLQDTGGFQGLAVARVDHGRVTFAALAPDGVALPTPQTPFELGSITKTFTGSLLADGIRRGELTLDAPVSTYLTELRGSPVGDATLRQLATHTAGLPSLPDAMLPTALIGSLANANVYDSRSVAGMLAEARATKVTGRGTYRYSNLGVSLLGHAEARAAGVVDWETLLQQRILDPLGMHDTHIALTAADVPADGAQPHLENGWPAADWYGAAFAPAGSSTWTTTADLARYATAQLAGTAPGATALDPISPIPGGQVGLAWHVLPVDGRQITWHNGATAGSRSILALDRPRGQAVIILGNSARDADTAGVVLAATASGAPVRSADTMTVAWPSVIAWSVLGLLMLVGCFTRLREPRSWLVVIDGAVSGAAGLVLLLAHGPWQLAPAWLWGGLTAATVVLILRAVLVRRASASPTAGGGDGPTPRRFSRLRTGLSLGSNVVLLAVALWTL